jgi:hypothetical protein
VVGVTAQAFKLAAGHEDFAGGSIAGPDGQTVDLKQLLDQGDGVIVTQHDGIAASLRTMPAFVTTPVPHGWEPPAPEEADPDALPGDLPALSRARLAELLDARGLPVGGTKDDMVARLLMHEQGTQPTGAAAVQLAEADPRTSDPSGDQRHDTTDTDAGDAAGEEG